MTRPRSKRVPKSMSHLTDSQRLARIHNFNKRRLLGVQATLSNLVVGKESGCSHKVKMELECANEHVSKALGIWNTNHIRNERIKV